MWLQRDLPAWFQNDRFSGGVRSYAFGPRGRVLRDRGPGVVMAGSNPLGAEQLNGVDRVVGAHRVQVADRQHGQIEAAAANQLHVQEERRVAGEVNAGVIECEQKTARYAAVSAIRHARAMMSDRELQVPERLPDAAAGIHADNFIFSQPFLLEPFAGFEIRDDRGSGSFRNRHGVADVIGVAVREQNKIRLYIGRLNRRRRRVDQERIEQYRLAGRFD